MDNNTYITYNLTTWKDKKNILNQMSDAMEI